MVARRRLLLIRLKIPIVHLEEHEEREELTIKLRALRVLRGKSLTESFL